jgi:hypothetical protein
MMRQTRFHWVINLVADKPIIYAESKPQILFGIEKASDFHGLSVTPHTYKQLAAQLEYKTGPH